MSHKQGRRHRNRSDIQRTWRAVAKHPIGVFEYSGESTAESWSNMKSSTSSACSAVRICFKNFNRSFCDSVFHADPRVSNFSSAFRAWTLPRQLRRATESMAWTLSVAPRRSPRADTTYTISTATRHHKCRTHCRKWSSMGPVEETVAKWKEQGVSIQDAE